MPKKKKETIEILPAVKEDDSSMSFDPKNLQVKKGGNIIIGTLNVFSSPVKKRWEKHYKPGANKRGHWHLMSDMILAIIIVFLAIFNILILTSGEWGITRKIALDIIGQEQITSGEKTSYTIKYQNNSKHKIKDAKLAINFPAGFFLEAIEPENIFASHTNTFNLEQIDPGANGEIKITGAMFADITTPTGIAATLSFVPEDQSKRQQKNTVFKQKTTNSLIKTELATPEKTASGKIFDIIIKYQNNSDFEIPELLIEPNFANMEIASQDDLTIENIKPNAKGEVKIKGKFTLAKDSDSKKMRITTKIALNGTKLVQSQINKEIEVIASKFIMELIPEKTTITLGEELAYTIKYQNKEKTDLSQVKITIKTEPEAMEQEISEAISHIQENKTDEIRFTLKTKKIDPPKQKNLTLNVWAEADYIFKNDPTLENFSVSEKKSQKVNTELVFNAFARYYTPEGDQLGIGPLPPIAGQITKYWIFFNLENYYNDAKDINITAHMPENARFTEKMSTTEEKGIEYNPENRIITWKLNAIQAPFNLFPSVGVAFEIALTPTNEQIGKIANLLKNIELTAIDSFTGEKITKNPNNITTSLIIDELSKNKGIIQKN